LDIERIVTFSNTVTSTVLLVLKFVYKVGVIYRTLHEVCSNLHHSSD